MFVMMPSSKPRALIALHPRTLWLQTRVAGQITLPQSHIVSEAIFVQIRELLTRGSSRRKREEIGGVQTAFQSCNPSDRLKGTAG